ncbi:MAG: peroxide stress protein YaaA [Pontiellaceae bacterium]
MMALLSPSKSMDMEILPGQLSTQPDFISKSEGLIHQLRKMKTDELGDFMEISNNLAILNQERFQKWTPKFTVKNAKPAIFAFTGDVYDGLDAPTLETSDQTYAQDHLRILSGLYGILRPLDLIQAYRLEMGRPLKTEQASNLYTFWRESIGSHLKQATDTPIINLASQEYFKAVPQKDLPNEIISPIFKDEKKGVFKIISFYAKKARGLMARYIIQNRIKKYEDLLTFNLNGYRYDKALSTRTEPVFIRPASAS